MLDLDLLEQIYDVPLRRCDWCAVVDRMRWVFRSDHAALLARDASASEPIRFLCPSRLSDSAVSAYADYYGSIDPYVAAVRSDAVPFGHAMVGDRVVSPRTLFATEFYCDWLRPNGMRYVSGGQALDKNGDGLMLSVPRSASDGPFEPEDLAAIQCHFGHIRRAEALSRALASAGPALNLDRVAARFCLTAAETKLVVLLLEEGSLRKAAARSRRSYNTLRAHLSSVMSKTDTRTQAQLIRLVHRETAV